MESGGQLGELMFRPQSLGQQISHEALLPLNYESLRDPVLSGFLRHEHALNSWVDHIAGPPVRPIRHMRQTIP